MIDFDSEDIPILDALVNAALEYPNARVPEVHIMPILKECLNTTKGSECRVEYYVDIIDKYCAKKNMRGHDIGIEKTHQMAIFRQNGGFGALYKKLRDDEREKENIEHKEGVVRNEKYYKAILWAIGVILTIIIFTLSFISQFLG